MPKKTISDEKKVVIKSLVDAGVPYRKVQEIIPVSLGQISNIVKEFEPNREIVEYYKKNRADMLTHDQILYRSHITPEKLEKTSARDLEIMRGVPFDKERLERDKSTQNVALIMEAINKIKEEEKAKDLQEMEQPR